LVRFIIILSFVPEGAAASQLDASILVFGVVWSTNILGYYDLKGW
jgi:hypothetical protein